MKKLLLFLLVFTCIFMVSCASSSSATKDRYEKERPENLRPSSKVYEYYGIDESIEIIDVHAIDDYEDMDEEIRVENDSTLDLKEMYVYYLGAYKSGNAEKPVLLTSIQNIKAGKTEKYEVLGDVSDFNYLIFEIVDQPIKIDRICESREMLYIHLVDKN